METSLHAKPRSTGDRLAGSSANFLITNTSVVFPRLDDRHDDKVTEILGREFPHRGIVGVPGREILLGGEKRPLRG